MMAAAKNYPFKIKQIPGNHKLGKIIYDSPHKREAHELHTAETLIKFGSDLMFIKPTDSLYIKTFDCSWRKILWEMKSPVKNRSETFVRDLREAKNQAPNIIIDVRRSGRSIRQVAIDVIEYLRKRKTKKIQRIFILDVRSYCYFERKDVL